MATPSMWPATAAKVGGIHPNNTYPADFILDNLLMECNVIGAAHAAAPVVHRTGSRID
jgi:GDP-L-fucose synthase